jgi:hypothetical protein
MKRSDDFWRNYERTLPMLGLGFFKLAKNNIFPNFEPKEK